MSRARDRAPAERRLTTRSVVPRDSRYYLIPRGPLLLAFFLLAALAVASVAFIWWSAPRWLPSVAAALDADSTIEDPEVVVLRASEESSVAEREAARLLAAGSVEQIVLVGRPSTPDNLIPPAPSPRVAALMRLGVPASAIVELYHGDELYAEMLRLRELVRERGWRRILFHTDALGSRRTLLVARHVLGPEGVEVGQTTFPLNWFSPADWWHDTRAQNLVVLHWVRLLVTYAAGRG